MSTGLHHPFLRSLGQRVRTLRRELRQTRRELATRSGLSERFLADIETGQANVSLRRLFDLASALGVDAVDLLSQARDAAFCRPLLALLGLRGAGKSTVGALVASRLSLPFAELDREVEARASLTLPEIFEFHGEDFYRRTEQEVLAGLVERAEPMVLATGGGLVTVPSTFALLKAKARTVWLKASPKDHWQRVVQQGDLRPMANNGKAFQQLQGILAEREQLYQQADVTIDTTDKTIEQVVSELVEHPLVRADSLSESGNSP